ncbi:MAG: PilZ domain-containing protein, partial [Candidatus Heimdallarchaeota archaeon]
SESQLTKIKPRNCKIFDISLGGIGITTIGKHNIDEGDYITVKFTLDTPASPTIEKEATVRWVKGNYIGCEFIDTDKNDTNIGFYLL